MYVCVPMEGWLNIALTLPQRSPNMARTLPTILPAWFCVPVRPVRAGFVDEASIRLFFADVCCRCFKDDDDVDNDEDVDDALTMMYLVLVTMFDDNALLISL